MINLLPLVRHTETFKAVGYGDCWVADWQEYSLCWAPFLEHSFQSDNQLLCDSRLRYNVIHEAHISSNTHTRAENKYRVEQFIIFNSVIFVAMKRRSLFFLHLTCRCTSAKLAYSSNWVALWLDTVSMLKCIYFSFFSCCRYNLCFAITKLN